VLDFEVLELFIGVILELFIRVNPKLIILELFLWFSRFESHYSRLLLENEKFFRYLKGATSKSVFSASVHLLPGNSKFFGRLPIRALL
jgi:hypothetical protein